jgi:hypothetical protein
MSLQQSYLAQPGYGYDMVVSVTQKGLNNGIQTYYDDTHTFSAVSFYFIKGTDGAPKQVDLSGIIVGDTSINIDPLSGTAKVPLTQAQINTIKASNLWFAFNMYIGNPAGDVQNYLTINPGSNTVDYYLLCKTLHVAFWNPDNSSWVDILQNTKNEFNINATISLQPVISNNNITKTVQNGINYIMSTYNLSSTDLNIQQLLFDADTAVLSPTSTLTGLASSCSVFTPLMQQFAKSYFSTYLVQAPALDYAVTQNNTSTLLPTNMVFFTNAFVDGTGKPYASPTEDQQDLATLSYLFSTGSDSLTAGKQFNWNFLDDNGSSHNPDLDTNADVNKYDGTIAINRNAFAKYLHKQLESYVLGNYYKATSIDVGNAFAGTPEYTIEIDWVSLNSNDGVQPLNVSMVGAGPDTLLSYACSSNVAQEGWASNGSMTANVLFMLTLVVDTPNYGQTCSKDFILTQTIWVHINSINSGTISNPDYNKYVISKTYTDTFSLVIDNSGDLNLVNTNSKLSDYSDPNPPTYINEAMQMFKNWNTAAAFEKVPVTMPQQFVFPGGNAFIFKDAEFSEYSDLVCHIKYLSED